MTTYTSDAELIAQQAEEITRLREDLRQERERRIMTALWGSRDEDCPRPFSLYRPEDAATQYGLNPGILGYGCMFADGFTIVSRTDFDGAPKVFAYTTFGELEDQGRPLGSYVVWLSEDLDDFTNAVTDAVERSIKNRARTESVRITVADTIRKAAPWDDARETADRVLTALFGVDES